MVFLLKHIHVQIGKSLGVFAKSNVLILLEGYPLEIDYLTSDLLFLLSMASRDTNTWISVIFNNTMQH